MTTINLSGTWQVKMPGSACYSVKLPGSLDTNNIGQADDSEKRAFRLTRLHVFEGEICFSHQVTLAPKADRRYFLSIERARALRLLVNGREISSLHPATLSTPYIFEVTAALQPGANTIELFSDNSYQQLPRFGILNSSAATDESQTNWNGLIGELKLDDRPLNFLEAVRVYPHGEFVDVEVALNAAEDLKDDLLISGTVFDASVEMVNPVEVAAGQLRTFRYENLPVSAGSARWDELDGLLQSLTIKLKSGLHEKTVTFGLRDFAVNDAGRLTINGRVFFLRGEANCAIFPETGFPPMTETAWLDVLQRYMAYGVNCLRFHSWCPPEAAFVAADQLGIFMQPELSHWDYEKALEEEASFHYYRDELREILLTYANHPSFVMLTFGNELWNEASGQKRMTELLALAHALDNTRLYASSSNPYYGIRGSHADSDFFTSHDYKGLHLRASSTNNQGHLYDTSPSANTNYDEAVNALHQDTLARSGTGAAKKKAVFGFEVGQYENYSDFSEIAEFRGVTRAGNLSAMQEKMRLAGLEPQWPAMVAATGELAFLAYREEVEAALRTEGLSGLSLLGLQDFTGQGTALVGLMNSHLQPKQDDFARPERFKHYFAPELPLLYLERYTYFSDEVLKAELKFANYGKTALEAKAVWEISGLAAGEFEKKVYPQGLVSTVGQITVDLSQITKATRLTIKVAVGAFENDYPLWVYPRRELALPDNILLAEVFNAEVKAALAASRTVYLEPEANAENFPTSIQSQFGTNFWSLGTFPEQAGGMSVMPDPAHPALADFPSETYCNWQWWPMASGRAMELPLNIQPVLPVLDSPLRFKHLGLLFEAKVGAGRLMVSGMALHQQLDKPECAALLQSLLSYLRQEKQDLPVLTQAELAQIIRER